MEHIFKLKEQLIQDQMFFRMEELKNCKSKAEEDKLKDRYVIEDAADRIANAISSSNRSRGFLRLF